MLLLLLFCFYCSCCCLRFVVVAAFAVVAAFVVAVSVVVAFVVVLDDAVVFGGVPAVVLAPAATGVAMRYPAGEEGLLRFPSSRPSSNLRGHQGPCRVILSSLVLLLLDESGDTHQTKTVT